jgi:hypothetical protein
LAWFFDRTGSLILPSCVDLRLGTGTFLGSVGLPGSPLPIDAGLTADLARLTGLFDPAPEAGNTRA